MIRSERLSRQPQALEEVVALMDSHNPLVIPRNHLVEEALVSASQGDMEAFHDFLKALSKPYGIPQHKKYLEGASAGFDASYQTFCGT
jgi:uncharacterized protein YdiU (UPF0061 family)